jgi:hypothetical protein
MTPTHPTWKAFLLMVGSVILLLMLSTLSAVSGR